jgi:hypothetical protein
MNDRIIKFYGLANSWVTKHVIPVLIFVTTITISFNNSFLGYLWAKFHTFMYQGEYPGKPVKAEALNTLLTFILTCVSLSLSWKAFKTSENANKISKLALEVERPNISIYFDKDKQLVILTNNGNIEAVSCFLLYIKNSTVVILNDSNEFNLSPQNKMEFETKTDQANTGRFSVLLVYMNVLTGKKYLCGIQISAGNDGIEQLTENSELKYSNYIKVYQAESSFKSPYHLVSSFIELYSKT